MADPPAAAPPPAAGTATFQPHQGIEVFALDVGQGDATLILPPGHSPLLFDCADDWVVSQVLRSWGIQELSAVIASHLDRDHIGGLQQFLENYTKSGGKVGRIYLSTDSRDVADSDPGEALVKGLIDYVVTEAEKGTWKHYPATVTPDPIASGPGWSIRLLAPTETRRLELERVGDREPNLLSGVLRLEIGGHAIVIGGDAPLRTWASLPPDDLRARVFRVPHHGGALTDGGVPKDWDVERLYDAVQPDVAVLSVGRGYNHPHPDWIAPVTGGSPCRLVCTQVTLRCEPSIPKAPAGLRLSAIQSPHHAEPPWRHLDAREAPRRDRYEVPCAGTVVVELRDDGQLKVLPEPDGAHGRLIDGWRSPLCRPTPS